MLICKNATLENEVHSQSYYLLEMNRRGEVSVLFTLKNVLPRYVKPADTLVLVGTLKDSDSFQYSYELINAEIVNYWRDNLGKCICKKQSCKHVCSKECPIYLNDLGFNEFEQNNFSSAEELFEEAITIAPYYTEAQFNLGRVYYKQRKYKEASVAHRYAYKDYNKNETCIYELTISLSELGKIKDAEDILNESKAYISSKTDEELIEYISHCKNRSIRKIRLTDEEYDVLSEKDFDQFWEEVIREKRSMYINKPFDYDEDLFEIISNRLRFLVKPMGGIRSSAGITSKRKMLIEDGVKDAHNLCVFDLILEYEHRYVKY